MHVSSPTLLTHAPTSVGMRGGSASMKRDSFVPLGTERSSPPGKAVFAGFWQRAGIAENVSLNVSQCISQGRIASTSRVGSFTHHRGLFSGKRSLCRTSNLRSPSPNAGGVQYDLGVSALCVLWQSRERCQHQRSTRLRCQGEPRQFTSAAPVLVAAFHEVSSSHLEERSFEEPCELSREQPVLMFDETPNTTEAIHAAFCAIDVCSLGKVSSGLVTRQTTYSELGWTFRVAAVDKVTLEQRVVVLWEVRRQAHVLIPLGAFLRVR